METQTGVGELVVLDRSGDTKMVWNAGYEEEVAAVKKTFDDLRKKGYLAYKVDKKGEKGSVMKEFDPDAEMVILAPPMVGG